MQATSLPIKKGLGKCRAQILKKLFFFGLRWLKFENLWQQQRTMGMNQLHLLA